MATIQTLSGVRGKTYRVQFMRDGRRVSKCFKRKKDAEKFLAQITLDDSLASSLTNYTLNTLTFQNAVTQYLEQYDGRDPSINQRLGYFINVFEDKPVGKITRSVLKAELDKLTDQGLSPATVNRYKASISSLFTFISNEFDIRHNPAREIQQRKESKGSTRFLSDDEQKRLLIACRSSEWNKLYLLVLMALTTGARRTELLTLTWHDIDLNNRLATLHNTKNGDKRLLPLTMSVVDELRRFKSTGYVFPHNSNLGDYFRNFDCHWSDAKSRAGINNCRFHDLRHTAASTLARNGATLLEIAEVLGHRSLEMTKRYAHLCVGHKSTLIDRVFG
ncbi:tyrosine-type recombinase/integrase [Vibrio sp.]|uniref:tyrosine-type recombinase/integrase n=1 Tax=Vibrio sp. TaxID=678 RepID=UPI003AA88B06